jgi:hypothetical protein
VLIGNVVGEPCVTIALEVFSKSLASEDFWERTGKAGGIFALKEDNKKRGRILRDSVPQWFIDKPETISR